MDIPASPAWRELAALNPDAPVLLSTRSDADTWWRSSEATVDAVRAEVPPERLVEWRPGDGWAPLCAALGVPEPDEPFPHVNTTAGFRERAGLI